MNNRASNKILSFVLAAVMLFTLLPGVTVQAATVEIQKELPSITVGTDGNSNPTVIGFGGYEWYVIGYDGSGVASDSDTMTLLAKNHDFGITLFHSSSNEYSGSDLQTAMDNAYSGLTDNRETALVIPRNFMGGATYNDDTDNVAGAAVSGACFWPLSVNEANSLDNSVRQYSDYWWLRSPGYINISAACVTGDGGVIDSGYLVTSISFAIRPAFKLNLPSVIFTSAAVGGKSVTVGGTSLASAEPTTGAVKLTLFDSDSSNLNLTCTDTAARTAKSGDTVSITYFDAVTGANKYVSCVIVNDSSGEVTHYGKLSDQTSDTASFTVPSSLADGDYTIKLFNEECNADNYTDYASNPANIALTVDNTNPTVTSVTPSGTNIATNTSALSVTFSEEMNTALTMIGTVSLDNGASLSGGVWQSDNKTIQYTLSGLNYNTPYTLNISGFMDVAGNVMDMDTGHSFTTTSSSGSSGGGSVSTYTVTFDSKEGSAVSKYTGVIYGNTIKTPADPTKSGYTFAGWYKDDTTFNTPWDFTTDKVTSNITLYAKWTSDTSPILNGWVKVGEDYYYYKNGVKATSIWITTKAGNKYYIGANGKMAKSKWITTKYGNKYYAQANGRMAKSKWITTKYGNKYYVDANGRMARSKWITTKYNNKYYVQTNGRMAKSKWIATKYGNKYYVQANGRMAKSKWVTTKYGNKYYVDANGRMTKKK